MEPIIRPFRPDEAGLYRSIRLEALRAHPEAFGASFETEAAEDLAFFEGRLHGSTVFGAFLDSAVLGTAGFRAEAGAKTAHKAMFWGMYVRPVARGTGLARRLVEAVLDHASGRVEIVQLMVVGSNGGARRLYESLGFEIYGVEARSLKVDGRYYDEVLMARVVG